MKELFYFSQSDLMVQVRYGHDSGSFGYSSHREITEGERKFIENYIRTKISAKTEQTEVSYQGINDNLARDLSEYHAKNNLNTLHEKHEKISTAVQDLIKESMSTYYFEQIGNKLIEVRKLMERGVIKSEINREKKNLAELVYAYNIYADQKVHYDKVLPNELTKI